MSESNQNKYFPLNTTINRIVVAYHMSVWVISIVK